MAGEHESELKDYIKEKGLKIRKEEDIISAAEFLNKFH